MCCAVLPSALLFACLCPLHACLPSACPACLSSACPLASPSLTFHLTLAVFPPPCPAGAAHSFFTASNGRMARQLMQILEEAGQPVPPELRQFSSTSGGPQSEPSRWGS